jgi:transcriptional regulator with XRE-family HTH domain
LDVAEFVGVDAQTANRFIDNSKPYNHKAMNIGDDRLIHLMQAVQITSFAGLCKKTGVSEKALRRLRRGALAQMQVVTLEKIAQGLNISLGVLVNTFSTLEATGEAGESGEALAVPPQDAQTEFQQAALQVLEPWLLQWSSAVHAAQHNPEARAVQLLALVRPVENLLISWGIQPIATVGETLPFNPSIHKLVSGHADPGASVKVASCGYIQGDRLIHRAHVAPVA